MKMEPAFDGNMVKTKLKLLSPEHRIAFVLLCCERLFPNYVFFSKQFEWGNPDILRKALDLGWSYLESEDVAIQIDDLILKCEENTPDTEDFASVYVSSALDAAVSITMLLQILIEEDIDKVVEIASLSIDTVDMYVQEHENMDSSSANLEKMILQHPLMQKELKRLSDDIKLLETTDLSNAAELSALESKFHGQSKSSIGL